MEGTPRKILEFSMAWKTFRVSLGMKLLLKCPAAYSLVRHLSCLNPYKMIHGKYVCVSKFTNVLSLLLNAKRVSENKCESLFQQYMVFSQFNTSVDRIAELFYELMASGT